MNHEQTHTTNIKLLNIMQNHNLPTDELKNFGIINDDFTFSKKLSEDDIQKFLQGYTIVADNDKNRATFQLTEDNTKLKVIFLERDKSLTKLLENSKEKVQYTDIKELSNEFPSLEKKAFVFDSETGKVVEFDFIKNATELTAIIADKKDAQELNRYKNELLKLKGFLQDKVDQYPEIAKEITNDVNIVSREIDAVSHITETEKQLSKGGDSDIQLNVNDRDMYEDANRNRKEQEEQSEEQEKRRGFRR
ncbi:Uncharacterised protein [Chryseobacterium gleum]|uniref:DUF3945 domain-containing protein n=3 Tax=Chryseobacterium TaxID=59732 RepID=A0A3S5E3B1_CHRGE|nr:hypothetical protein HMPREF0204_14972 [Chryseobacterium gleum ATCC 35910]MDV3993908.1 hypothetical protein [Elizabethkingia anophelis]MDV4007182.1 hypothetical protein [Elizabethkingia anophelis]VEE11523.1 Uncharacterised protein [Chryseobacterium gleum]